MNMTMKQLRNKTVHCSVIHQKKDIFSKLWRAESKSERENAIPGIEREKERACNYWLWLKLTKREKRKRESSVRSKPEAWYDLDLSSFFSLFPFSWFSPSSSSSIVFMKQRERERERKEKEKKWKEGKITVWQPCKRVLLFLCYCCWCCSLSISPSFILSLSHILLFSYSFNLSFSCSSSFSSFHISLSLSLSLLVQHCWTSAALGFSSHLTPRHIFIPSFFFSFLLSLSLF